jgi:hypothetical protein
MSSFWKTLGPGRGLAHFLRGKYKLGVFEELRCPDIVAGSSGGWSYTSNSHLYVTLSSLVVLLL